MSKKINSGGISEFTPINLFRSKVTSKSLKNLKPFKKGQSGNPKGRPVGRLSFETIFMKALYIFERNEEEEILVEMFKHLVVRARNGDIDCIKLIMDFQYGKPE